MRRMTVIVFALAVLALTALGAPGLHALDAGGSDVPVPADATAFHGSWDAGIAGAAPLYSGMSVHDVGCMLTPGSAGCGWELAFALRDGAFCVLGLVGVGKAIMAWRLKKRREKLNEATKAKKARGRAIVFAIIGLLAGECLDFAASLMELLDCWGVTQADPAAMPPRPFRPPSLRAGALA